MPRPRSSTAAAIAASSVSPATKRVDTARPGRVDVTTCRNRGWPAIRRIAGRNTLVERPTGALGLVLARGDPVAQDLQELLDPHAATFRAPVDQTGIEVF